MCAGCHFSKNPLHQNRLHQFSFVRVAEFKNWCNRWNQQKTGRRVLQRDHEIHVKTALEMPGPRKRGPAHLQSRFSFFPQETLRWFPAECLQYFGQSISDWPDTVGTFYLLPGQHLDKCTRLVAADNLLIERFAVTHGGYPCPFI